MINRISAFERIKNIRSEAREMNKLTLLVKKKKKTTNAPQVFNKKEVALNDDGPNLKDDEEGRKLLGQTIFSFYHTLKTYGRSPDRLDEVIRMFIFALADYPTKRINKAFKIYLARSSDFPTPSDIVKLIQLKGRPDFNVSVYNVLQKRIGNGITAKELEYIKDYENYIISGEIRWK